MKCIAHYAVLAAFLIFSSCSKDPTNPVTDSGKSRIPAGKPEIPSKVKNEAAEAPKVTPRDLPANSGFFPSGETTPLFSSPVSSNGLVIKLAGGNASFGRTAVGSSGSTLTGWILNTLRVTRPDSAYTYIAFSIDPGKIDSTDGDRDYRLAKDDLDDDNDFIPDDQDPDRDGDGIPNNLDDGDWDNDGVADWDDFDDNGDGINEIENPELDSAITQNPNINQDSLNYLISKALLSGDLWNRAIFFTADSVSGEFMFCDPGFFGDSWDWGYWYTAKKDSIDYIAFNLGSSKLEVFEVRFDNPSNPNKLIATKYKYSQTNLLEKYEFIFDKISLQ
jgi:hypothetical protein